MCHRPHAAAPGPIARAATLLAGCAWLLTGCASPVGVRPVTAREYYQEASANPMNAGVLSNEAEYVLNRHALLRIFRTRPAEVIAQLHEKSLTDERRDLLYALSEMSYIHAGQLAASVEAPKKALARDYYLLSAVYAYYFVFDRRPDPPPDRLDHRLRNALDLYTLGLWLGLATGRGPHAGVDLTGGVRRLPFGDLTLSLDTSQLPWPVEGFERFLPADQFQTRGVAVLDRLQGIGLPLIGIRKGADPTGYQALPVTAVLVPEGSYAAFGAGGTTATLGLHTPLDSTEVHLDGGAVPLEADLTTPMVYRLEGSSIWNSGIRVFFGKEAGAIPNGLYLHQAHRPGRIPVVFVHGTASSPVWWTEMFNSLSFDPVIRRRYEFWYFVYASGEPVTISAANLRDALRAKVAELTAEGDDPALSQMVVIGHSQGGLLTKLSAVSTGDRLLRSLASTDLEAMDIPGSTKAELRRILFVEPLPFVSSVVFLSTPHRGSFRSKWWVRGLVRSMATLPATVVQQSKEYFSYMNNDLKKVLGSRAGIATSADGQSPDNPMLQVLAGIPLAPWIKGHSIIGVKGGADPRSGDDGVVKYSSAHLDGMASELVVRSDHSTQLNPLAIEEVRRILVEHLADAGPPPAVPQ